MAVRRRAGNSREIFQLERIAGKPVEDSGPSPEKSWEILRIHEKGRTGHTPWVHSYEVVLTSTLVNVARPLRVAELEILFGAFNCVPLMHQGLFLSSEEEGLPLLQCCNVQ